MSLVASLSRIVWLSCSFRTHTRENALANRHTYSKRSEKERDVCRCTSRCQIMDKVMNWKVAEKRKEKSKQKETNKMMWNRENVKNETSTSNIQNGNEFISVCEYSSCRVIYRIGWRFSTFFSSFLYWNNIFFSFAHSSLSVFLKWINCEWHKKCKKIIFNSNEVNGQRSQLKICENLIQIRNKKKHRKNSNWRKGRFVSSMKMLFFFVFSLLYREKQLWIQIILSPKLISNYFQIDKFAFVCARIKYQQNYVFFSSKWNFSKVQFLLLFFFSQSESFWKCVNSL